MRKTRRKTQGELSFPSTWGGRREGAGRKKQKGSGVERRRRPAHDRRHPVHVTLRVTERVLSLRSVRSFRVIEAAFRAGADRLGIRLTHYSVQGNHLHLIVEAEDATSLSRGMQGLTIRLARGLNKLMGTKGKVFADRFHARALATPTEVRRGIAYVLENARKHGFLPANSRFDRYAGGPGLDGAIWETASGRPPPIVSARTWLLRVGWRREAVLRQG